MIVSTERTAKDIALPERARRLLEDSAAPAAIFTADGELIVAQPAAREQLGDKLDLIAFGAEKLAREASLNGVAEGATPAGHVNVLKLGAGATFVLLVIFDTPQLVANAAVQEPEFAESTQSGASRTNFTAASFSVCVGNRCARALRAGEPGLCRSARP